MKKVLLAAGILLIITGVLAFLTAMFFYWASYNTLDGSAGLFYTQQKCMYVSLAAGVIGLAAGIVCLVRRKK